MSRLSKLELSQYTRAQGVKSPEQRKRDKLQASIENQVRAFEANEKNKLYSYIHTRFVTNDETGERLQEKVRVRVKHWWWKDEENQYYLIVKYGTRKIEFEPGKSTVIVGAKSLVIPTFKLISEAVRDGELDLVLENMSWFGKPPVR